MGERPTPGGTPGGADQPSGPRVDVDRIRDVLDEHPVRLAVLFGSQVTGSVDSRSDVDVAIEFDEGIEDRGQALLQVLTDLSVALDRNDIDLLVVDDMKPRVGRAAFSNGKLLCGSAERVETHRRRFEELVDVEQSDRSLRERFDETLDRIDRLVETGD